VHVQIVGLNADTEKCRHGAEGGIFLLLSPSIGRFYDGQPEAEAQLNKEAPIERPDLLVRSYEGEKSKCLRVRRLGASSLYPTFLSCPCPRKVFPLRGGEWI
jgi:hypothetical protein